MRTLFLKLISAGSDGMSTQSPVDVELPAVVDAAQAVFLVAAEEHRGAAVRAGVLHRRRPRRRSSRKAMRFSPSRRRRTGGQSGDGSSSDSSAGIQYWRMRSPIGVPGPTRHSSLVVFLLSIVAPPLVSTVTYAFLNGALARGPAIQ